MVFETAAKVLSYGEDCGMVIGEFWVDDNMYDVVVSEDNSYSNDIRVEIDNIEGYDDQVISNHHRINTTGFRSYAGTERSAKLPENDEELEAYVLKALSMDDTRLSGLSGL